MIVSRIDGHWYTHLRGLRVALTASGLAEALTQAQGFRAQHSAAQAPRRTA